MKIQIQAASMYIKYSNTSDKSFIDESSGDLMNKKDNISLRIYSLKNQKASFLKYNQ